MSAATLVLRHKMSSETLWSLTIVWLVLLLFILVLNLPILYIFWSSEQLRSPRNMYIASLIVSDLLIGLMIPVKLYLIHADDGDTLWIAYLCYGILVLQTFVMFVNLYSVLGLTLVRHRDITMSRAHRQSRREACVCIVFLWIASILSSMRMPYVPQHNAEVRASVRTVLGIGSWSRCSLPMAFQPNVIGFTFLLDFMFPTATIIFLCLHARRHMYHVRCAKDPVEGAAVKKRDCRVVSMVLSLVHFFILLHLPMHVIYLVAYIFSKDLFLWFEVAQLIMFSTAVSNIIIYVFFNRRAAAVFLAFMKLHRGSQVGVDARDTVSQMSRDTPNRTSTMRERMSLVAFNLLRYNTASSVQSSPRDYSMARGTTTTSQNLSPSQAPFFDGKASVSSPDT